MPGDDHLIALAARIADGAQVDWQSIEAEAGSDADRTMLAELRLLERLAELHSKAAIVPQSPGAPPASSIERPAVATPSRWGPLTIQERIGSGSYGDVYRAWDTQLSRDVALKLLRPPRVLHASTETLPESSIIEEGRVMARIRHPGVVTVHGAERVDGQLGVWMELLEGRTLADEVADRGPLPVHEVRQIGAHLADALAAVHRAGVLHRDVKAQNVIREPNGRTVLMDFGTGLRRDDAAGALAGTPLYLAPEVIAGGPATRQSDIYSLGVLLFHLATASFPVDGPTLGEIRRAHARGHRRRLRDCRPDLPRLLSGTIERALAPDPANRFADAAAMCDALRGSGGPSNSRSRMGAAVGVTLAIAGLGGAAVWRVNAPASAPRPEGVTETQIDPDLQLRAAIRGPAFNSLVPCGPRMSRGIALCDLRDGSIRPIRMPGNSNEFSALTRALIAPNGRALAYVWIEGNVGGPMQHSIHVVSLDGTRTREIYRSDMALELLRWTATGDALAVREAPMSGQDDRQERVIIASLGGGHLEQLLHLERRDTATDVSPDRRTVLVRRRVDGDDDVVALAAGTGEERWRLEGPTRDASAMWAPDGRGVVFITDRSGCESVAYLGVDGDQPAGRTILLKDLGRNRASPIGFSSSDGSYLISLRHAARTAFAVRRSAAGESGGTPRSLVYHCAEDSVGADWDPSGERIAYLSGSFDRAERARVIVQSRDGRVEREITAPGTFHMWGRVRWSPDGRQLAVIIKGLPGPDELHLLDLRSGEFRVVAQSSGKPNVNDGFLEARWQGDGGALYFRQGGDIRRYDLQTSATGVVYEGLGQTFSSFDVGRADGALLVAHYSRKTNECTIRIVSAGAAIDRHRMPGECFALAWNRDASSILVGVAVGGNHKVMMLDRFEGLPSQVAIDADAFWDFSASPDDRELLFSAGNPMPNMVLLKGIGLRR